ncbi:MAG: hypothetical protein ACOYJL_00740 [Tractidigestivibacter sp.]|jgi:hypothetical protein|uniref:hypothetical protein n=1 Tax=Tractidigestivibacter sp. TaxID=2847320 RepID=UPI003D8E1E68
MASKNESEKALMGWLWFAAATVVIGAIMLYPIGTPVANVAFLLVKAGMLAGIVWLMRSKSKAAWNLWATFSALAVVMTLIKWQLAGSFSWTFALAMATDVIVPAIGRHLLNKAAA